MKNTINVLIADDHQMFIDGLRAVIKDHDDIVIVGQAVNGIEVIDFVKKSAEKIDIILLDIMMPEMDGAETIRQLKDMNSEAKVIIISMHKRKDLIMHFMSEGAYGFVLKNRGAEELISAIHRVNSGNTYYSLEVMNEITSVGTTSSSSSNSAVLTSREIEILKLIAEGLKTKEIAGQLYISVPTVNTHRRNIMRKLDLPNERLLVRYAIREGLIEA